MGILYYENYLSEDTVLGIMQLGLGAGNAY